MLSGLLLSRGRCDVKMASSIAPSAAIEAIVQHKSNLGKHVFGHDLPAGRATELLKPSKNSESLVVSIKKYWYVLSFGFKLFLGKTQLGQVKAVLDNVIGVSEKIQMEISLFFFKKN